MMSASHAAIPKRVIPELNSGCSGTHLDFSQELKTDVSDGGEGQEGKLSVNYDEDSEISGRWNSLKSCLCENEKNNSVHGT